MKNDSLALKAYNEIRRKILSGQLAVNTRLKEDFWSNNLNVSRIAVREGLTRLLGEDLVFQGEKGGFFVAGIREEFIHEIRELREILELGALRLLFNNLTDNKLQVLDKICQDFTDMVQNGYFAGACEADLKFHETLIQFSENRKLIEIYQKCHIPLFHSKITKAQSSQPEYEQTDKEHRGILKAIRERDIKQAEKIMRIHFDRGILDVSNLKSS